MKKNPFYFRVIPIDAPFCDREDEQKALISYALSNTNVVLYSPRRYGKTSLVARVQDQLEKKGMEVIYIDISNCSSCDEISKKIAVSIYSLARKKESLLQKLTNTLKAWRPVFTPDPAGGVSLSVQPTSGKRGIELLQETMESFNKILKEDDRQFNIVIDEFQEIAGVKDGNKIEALLREYIQHQKNVSYFFLGSRRRLLVHMFTQKDRPFYKSSINFELPPLPREEAMEFVMARFNEGGKECPLEITERIIETTQCYPYYVQRLPFAMYEVSTGEDIRDADFTAGFAKMMAEEGLMFSAMEKALPAGQKNLLRALASEPTDKPYAVSYTGRHNLGSLGSIQNAVKRLEELDYIERDKEKCYRITDPMFASWLASGKEVPYSKDIANIEAENAPAASSFKVLNVQKAMQSGIAEISGYETKEFEEVKGILPREKSGKPEVKIFLSYSHSDKTLKNRFFDLIHNRLKTSNRYDFSFSVDTDILVGEKWHGEIQKMVKKCDFGLLLLSTNFLNSEYIANHELPRLIEKCIPVALDILDFKRQDLKGLQENQIFRYEDKAFSEFKGSNLTRFVNELARQVEEKVEKAQKTQPSQPQEEMERLCEEAGITDVDQCHAYFKKLHEHEKGYERELFTYQRGIRGAITHQTQESGGDKVNVLEHLYAWAVNDDTPFFALLGDFGAGKTFTCKMLARRIDGDHNQKPDEFPLCIYIDLRRVSTRNKENRVPSLVEILDDAIRQAKDLLDRTIVTAEDLIRLVRQGKAMVIYDGLDEKTVHFTPDETNEFVRQLWSIREIRAGSEEEGGPRQGKILASCRTHYFRDVIEQNSLFLGKDREGRGVKEFSSCLILPFDDNQIREYLKKRLGCDDAEIGRLTGLMGSVHNLRELAGRPYLLSLITEFLPDIEKMGTGGKIINTASLYELMVQNWLARDDGKHEFGVLHKKTLMEAMALEIHQRGERSIKTGDLEGWLDHWLFQNPAIQSAYTNINRETLKKDLRTATFIIREEDKDFRFAHTSLQEYFLARHIVNLLSRRAFDMPKDIQGLAMPFPSWETLDFAVEILTNEKEKSAFFLKNMEALLERAYEKGASELCLGLWQRLRDKGMRIPNPKTVYLEGAFLTGWNIRGLDLSNAVLDGANLEDARFEEVQLPAASFVSATMLNSEFLHCNLAGGDFSSASAPGSVWKDCNLSSTKWGGASARLADFVRCDMKEVSLSPREDRNIVLCKGIEGIPRPRDFHIAAFTGHSSWVNSCAVSPDNQWIVSASSDSTLKVWDTETGKCLKTLEGHAGSVTSCAVSPDNRRIVSASADNTLKVWNAETGKCLMTLEGHSSWVNSCAVSPDNRWIVSASDDNTLKVWDAETGKCIQTLEGHYKSVNSCAVSPDNRWIVSASADSTLKVWDFQTGKCLQTLEGHYDSVNSCAVSPDNRRIVSASTDNTLKVWNAETGKCIQTLEGHSTFVNSCAVSPDNRRIVSASSDNTLKVWDAETGKCIQTLKGHSGIVTSCAVSLDNRRIVSASWDNILKVWDAKTGEYLNTLGRHSFLVNSCVISLDKRWIVSTSPDSTLKVWDAEIGKCIQTLEGHYFSVNSCAVSPDNRWIVSSSWDYTLKVWDKETGRCLSTLEGHSSMVNSCAVSPDNRRIVSASADNTLKVWDAETGKCLKTLEGHSSWVTSCAVSPDNRRIVSASADSTLKVWDAETGKCLKTLEGHSSWVTSCAVSPDNRWIVSASTDNTLKVWDFKTGKCLQTLEGHSDSVNSCAISPDSGRIVSASADSTLKVWDFKTGKCIRTLEGHSNRVNSCAVSPDNRRIVSASTDSTLKVWDIETGECLKTFAQLPEGETAAWDGEGKKLLSFSPFAWRWIGLSSGMKRFPVEAIEA